MERIFFTISRYTFVFDDVNGNSSLILYQSALIVLFSQRLHLDLLDGEQLLSPLLLSQRKPLLAALHARQMVPE